MKHSLRERLRRIISIALAVAIALLIALSLGRPQIEWLTGRTQRIAIVLDTSPSMNAKTADGSTRWQHAVARARDLIDGAGPAAELRIADTSGETAFPFTTDRAEARANLEMLSPEGNEPEFPMLDTRNSTVYFISDGVGLRDVPNSAHRISVFEPADNVAITAFRGTACSGKPARDMRRGWKFTITVRRPKSSCRLADQRKTTSRGTFACAPTIHSRNSSISRASRAAQSRPALRRTMTRWPRTMSLSHTCRSKRQNQDAARNARQHTTSRHSSR